MLLQNFKIFGLLFYKNFLVLKRHWKMGLFVEILIPIIMFLSVWSMRNLLSGIPKSIANETFPIVTKDFHIPEGRKIVYAVPDNEFTENLMELVRKCMKMNMNDAIIKFDTEDMMAEAFKHNATNSTILSNGVIMAVVFKDKNINLNTTKLDYTILTPQDYKSLSLYSTFLRVRNIFTLGTSGLQLCVDESFIKLKKQDPDLSLQIFTQKIPIPAHVEIDMADEEFRKAFCYFALIAFLIPLCIETSNASDEKFLGIHVLMAMNGVSNCLNLLSWLFSGLIFSLFYIVPIVIILNFSTNEHATPFLHYGNPIIIWLIFTLNITHLITFGMHISAYFTKSLFMVTGILILYAGSSVLHIATVIKTAPNFVPYLGIFFPNVLLYRACEEINYYESIFKGIHWDNIFRVGILEYGPEGSIGGVLICSLIGTVFHFILANYIYAINPGKYGVKKGLFYFLKFFKISRKSNYGKVEDYECNDTMNGKPFESVPEGVYTPGIQIRNLKKIYKSNFLNRTEVHALRGVSIDFYKGQITALLGHNGAGKTTLMSVLTGMLSATEGLVNVDGKNIKHHLDEILSNVGLCPQENMVFPNLSVSEQLRFFAKLKNKGHTKLEVENRVTSFLEQLKLFDKRHALPKHLSGGQRRRLCLGMALIGDSKTLILDEPTSGLDPESKRDIWDMLLKMRGEKTILISTHDMEEADILGDRIAILHSGLLKSYGTSMYLKKLIGKGNIEVTFSTAVPCEPEKVPTYFDSQSEVLSKKPGKLVLSVPYTSELPDSLDKIDKDKKELGITGMSVSLITLEKVFLRVTQENENNEQHESVIRSPKKLKDKELYISSAKALLFKKLTYTLKNISAILIMLLMAFAALGCMALVLRDTLDNDNPVEIKVNLEMYQTPKTCFRTNANGIHFGGNYRRLTEANHGKVIGNFSENSDMNHELQDIGLQDIRNYDNHLIAAAEFNQTQKNITAAALYTEVKAVFSLPISINLMMNTILKSLIGSDYSIGLSVKQLPFNYQKYQDLLAGGDVIFVEGYFAAVVLVLLLYPAVALFIIHPLRESVSNIKHLQRMSGVSSFNYWGTMFIFDLAVLFLLILVFIIGFVVMNYVHDLTMFGPIEILIEILLFILFAINVLPLIYIFSFSKKSTHAAIKLLSLLPLGLVPIELILHSVKLVLKDENYKFSVFRKIQRGIFLLFPHISFFHGQLSILSNAKTNAYCKQMNKFSLCNGPCEIKCQDDGSGEYAKYFNNFEDDVSLEISLIALCLTPFLYFGILSILEFKLVPKIIARIRGGMPRKLDQTYEEQVKKVKRSTAYEISKIRSRQEGMDNGKFINGKLENIENGEEEIVPMNDDAKSHIFLVYELRKLYGNFVAVEDISFGVNQSECFGLLGVNGAGKTTTFKMLTGEIIPNYGFMYLNNEEIRNNLRYYFSQLGYCPQNDALIKSLNSYDHLHLFARIRGIPEDQVEIDVKKWIDRLNLSSCASQPSGTYSGGNRRRLNIAIALIGVPNLVLLDEPTTGVDPAARRSLWNTIQACQTSGQAVILTSHSMDECEALCNRLAIMVEGRFVCIGQAQELKQRFGASFNIQLKLNPEKAVEEKEAIKKEMSESLSCEIIDENSGYLMYHITTTDITWKRMYDVVRDLKTRYKCIEDFSVLSSTLEQLFLLFSKAAKKSPEDDEEETSDDVE